MKNLKNQVIKTIDLKYQFIVQFMEFFIKSIHHIYRAKVVQHVLKKTIKLEKKLKK